MHSPDYSAVPRLAAADVVVVGSGSAGSVAAIAAARGGASTLLLERYGFPGGTSTGVLDTFYGFYTPGSKSAKVVGGVADDVISNLEELGGCLQRPNTYGAGTGITYNPEYLKIVWELLASEAGASTLYHAWVQDVIRSGSRVAGLLVATKQGLRRVEGKVFVDASGDADVCAWAGVPFELAGEHEPAQSLTTTFRVCNVDVEKRYLLSKDRFHALMAESAHEFGLPRKEGSDHRTTIPGVLATNMTRVRSFDWRDGQPVNASDPMLLSEAETEGRAQTLLYLEFLKRRVPGYESAELVSFSNQVGVRETRRVYGEYRLTREDVLSARQFDDQIGLCGAPIEDHHSGDTTTWTYLPDGGCVGIPYRTLLPQKCENLLVAGRCFSATHDAHASVRSMAQCMAMGQAAGAAAALSVKRNTSPHELSAAALRDRLHQDGAILEMPGE